MATHPGAKLKLRRAMFKEIQALPGVRAVTDATVEQIAEAATDRLGEGLRNEAGERHFETDTALARGAKRRRSSVRTHTNAAVRGEFHHHVLTEAFEEVKRNL